MSEHKKEDVYWWGCTPRRDGGTEILTSWDEQWVRWVAAYLSPQEAVRVLATKRYGDRVQWTIVVDADRGHLGDTAKAYADGLIDAGSPPGELWGTRHPAGNG